MSRFYQKNCQSCKNTYGFVGWSMELQYRVHVGLFPCLWGLLPVEDIKLFVRHIIAQLGRCFRLYLVYHL